MRKVSYERGGVSGLEETTRERETGVEGGGGGGVVRAFLHAFLLLACSHLSCLNLFHSLLLWVVRACVLCSASLRVDWYGACRGGLRKTLPVS